MTRDEIQDKVVAIVCEQLEESVGQVGLETRYAEDLGADSLDTAELVMELEEEFDLHFTDEAEGKIKTIGETVAYIEAQVRKKGS